MPGPGTVAEIAIMASNTLIPLVAATVFTGVAFRINESRDKDIANLTTENIREIGKFEASLTTNLEFAAFKIKSTHERSGMQTR